MEDYSNKDKRLPCLICAGCSMQLWGALEVGSMRRVREHLDGVLMGRCVEEEEESEVCCQHTKKGTCASWQIHRAGSCPTLSPQLSFLEGLLVPNRHSLLPPRLYLRSQTSPAPGPAGDEETGSSRDSAGGRTGRLETKPEPSWVLARVPVCSLLGVGRQQGPSEAQAWGRAPSSSRSNPS